MILDEYNEFCDADTLTTTTGTNLEGDVIDLGANNTRFGDGQQVYCCIEVTTAVTSAGAATVQFQLASDAAAAIATDGSATILGETEAIGKATLVAGYKRVIAIPPGVNERYLGILAVVGTAALTAGAINAFLTLDPPAEYLAYPNAANS